MSHLDVPGFRRPLAETITWCERQIVPSILFDEHYMNDRRALLDELGNLMKRAYERTHVFDLTKTAEWEKAEQIRGRLKSVEIGTALRSPELRPLKVRTSNIDAAWKFCVGHVVAARAELVSIPRRPLIEGLQRGRLLIYSPSENLADGAAEFVTMGFFDADNIPPWDTWVLYSEDILVSWIPPQFTSLVQEGIDVNPEGCIRWTD